ncbi:MAG: hypothetical protein ROO70_03755 [Labrenzia sp.]
MRQVPRYGGDGPAERIGHTLQGLSVSDRRFLSNPRGRVSIPQFRRKSVLMMHKHHHHQISLILKDANPGEMHLQFAHTA